MLHSPHATPACTQVTHHPRGSYQQGRFSNRLFVKLWAGRSKIEFQTLISFFAHEQLHAWARRSAG